MKEVPLARLDVQRPPRRTALGRQLAEIQLPARTAALLREMGPAPLIPGVSRVAAGEAATAAVGAALRTLVGHLAAGSTDPAGYRSAAAALAGLGPGLTPTGDDVLVALVATSRLLSAGPTGAAVLLPRAAADELAAAVAGLPSGVTTEIAQHLLAESVAGRYPEPLAALVAALGDSRADRGALNTLVERLVATGAHSGADWLAGVVALASACLGAHGHRESACRTAPVAAARSRSAALRRD